MSEQATLTRAGSDKLREWGIFLEPGPLPRPGLAPRSHPFVSVFPVTTLVLNEREVVDVPAPEPLPACYLCGEPAEAHG